MARTSIAITQQEIDAFQKFCNEHRIVTEGEVGRANGDLFGDYIAITRGVDITPATLAIALEKLRDRIVFYTPAQAAYKKIADEDPARANALNAWFHSPANTSLMTEGEPGYQNQTVLLAELRGRGIDSKSINDAIGRASFKRGLHYVPTPRSVDPRQHAASGAFAPKSETNLTARDHAKRAADAAAAASGNKQPSESTDYRALSEQIKGRTHSATERIARLFITKPGTSEILWPETYEARKRAAGL
jgi:hypothetical protein